MAENIYNRELSWLQFNDRVLQEARDKTVPLMQRLRFLGIFSNNQDEFIRVRLAHVLRLAKLKGKNQPKMTGGLTGAELLPLIDRRMEVSRETFIETYAGIMTEMADAGVHIINEADLSDKQREFCHNYFHSVVSMRLVPLMLRKSVDIPFLPDGEVYLAVRMSGPKSCRYAILQIPVSGPCPRFVVLPPAENSPGKTGVSATEAGSGSGASSAAESGSGSAQPHTDVIFLDDIIRLCLDEIFFMFNYESITAHTFKIVRDAEFELDDDVSKSMSDKMFQGLQKRRHGRPVRLVYDRSMPDDMLQTISHKLGHLSAGQLEPGVRYHQMRDLMKFPVVRPEMEEAKTSPIDHPLIDPSDSILKVIRRQDVLLCYPYHTFNHVIDLLREAAIDPRVQCIKITLYRTAEYSKVIHTLLSAVRNGKHVTALVELKARFDEEQNIEVTDALQSGGVKVVHSLEGLKVHSKLLLIERSEGSTIRGYVYVGTGNFNENTTRIYGDFGLLTADQTAVEDARKVFDFLQNTHKHPDYKRLMVSPYYMRDQIEDIIDAEIKHAKRGKKAYIHAKFNSLTDERMIEKLYDASRTGVKIRLIIRGSCCLVAGQKGYSENIEVHSIVDKYLEHARLLIAAGGGKPQSWIMSADLMSRNMDRRVEVGIPIRDKKIHAILERYFAIQWGDNTKARLIVPPYENGYVARAENAPRHRSQTELYDYFEAQSK